MTEQEWLRSESPCRLFAHARRVAKPGLKSGRRRLRLYACACCREVWPLLGEEGRAAVEAAERYADGRASAADLRQAAALAWQAYRRSANTSRLAGTQATLAACLATQWSITGGGREAAERAALAFASTPEALPVANAARRLLQCDLVRDIFGNPFRLPPRSDAAWLVWNDGTVKRLAEAVYEGRPFDRLPILADALEEAGCDAAELLAHLRGPGPHVRGCWAVDLLLGKTRPAR